MWHWQQWYFIIMLSLTSLLSLIGIMVSYTLERRLSNLVSVIMLGWTTYVLWSAGFFA